MNIWRLSSSWSQDGNYDSTILDIFWKHGVVFIRDDGKPLHSVNHADNDEEGDLIAVTDGDRIVGLAKPLTAVLDFTELKMGLRKSDAQRLSDAEADIRGFRVRFLNVSDLDDLGDQEPSRFCRINDETLKTRLKEIWTSKNCEDASKAFKIEASTKTLDKLIREKGDQDVTLYQVPVYQRPYAWGEDQIQRFLGDIIRGINKGEDMFIGTIQLSAKRLLDPRGEYYQEVIDGQQRLTTCALILKALELLSPDESFSAFTKQFTWIETRVSNGLMQKYLDQTLFENALEDSSELNIYATNLKLIKKILEEWMSKDGEENSWQYNPLELFEYLTKKLHFVVIQTEAGLSKTLQIFNTINTAGLDLNGGDLFKVRAYEYFKDYHQFDCFDDISELYEKIDRINSNKRRSVCSIQEVLNIYQTIIVGKTYDPTPDKQSGLPISTIRFAPETFFERLFDTRFGIQRWENFTSVTKLDLASRIIDLNELQWIVEECNRLDSKWYSNNLYTETFLAFNLIYNSRYSEYIHLWHVFRFAYKDHENRQKLSTEYMKALARLFTIYSIIYAKKVNEMHTYIGNLVREMFNESAENIIDKLNEKIETKRDHFYSELDSQFAWYPTPKNLLCRLLEWLAREPAQRDPSETRMIFEGSYDIEHIQSLNDIKQEEREAISKEWGDKINGLGNLMLLEYDINRSIGNKTFDLKILRYGGDEEDCSKLTVPNSISKDYQGNKIWKMEFGEKKLQNDKEQLMRFIFG
ncbi:DUF262 domain-containing protein [Ruficoccus sp. ZRK36]|uniref:DUF262 domain-containing protein n=1 Tax=Ruficoccus sp. ZRK36 TaxID=2866311 RepID=UPI001C72C02F|nr:DUF262 domain-containing protein [Ruficoccus sp. ZRK36]QYY37435.1 DUF262 domain-containing HNH endonuclease family protein [Ruficoccus sp. ZRK36]